MFPRILANAKRLSFRWSSRGWSDSVSSLESTRRTFFRWRISGDGGRCARGAPETGRSPGNRVFSGLVGPTPAVFRTYREVLATARGRGRARKCRPASKAGGGAGKRRLPPSYGSGGNVVFTAGHGAEMIQGLEDQGKRYESGNKLFESGNKLRGKGNTCLGERKHLYGEKQRLSEDWKQIFGQSVCIWSQLEKDLSSVRMIVTCGRAAPVASSERGGCRAGV
jgi:hypothetical protein